MGKHNQTVQVNGKAIPTDSEGYLQNRTTGPRILHTPWRIRRG